MSRRAAHGISRRSALAGFAVAAACGAAVAGHAHSGMASDEGSGPGFSPSGPDAKAYGEDEGFPVADRSLAMQPGEPFSPKYRVGAYSHFDEIYPTRRIGRASRPWLFKRERTDIRYAFRGRPSSLAAYLARNAVTGLLIAADDRILFEHYQYGRSDRDRLLSQSMAKSITSMLVGAAIGEGAIASVDDPAETYVPGFAGSEYGRTPIRDLLHMSSGVAFGETEDGQRDLDRLWIDMVLGKGPRRGTIDSIVQFNRRIAPPGTRYAYASIEADVLGVVLRHAVNRPLVDYLQAALWEPIGAEADAAWVIDAQGFEVAHGFFNAVLRDYARLGRLLAHDGAWDRRQIIPAPYVIDATSTRPSDAYLRPGNATPTLGYGYLVWLIPGPRRQFALIGANGQRICVDPASKLVMVQTAVADTDEVWHLWSALVEQFGQG
jgi:CubicO group peptidase (beta-lactamase class C family)